MREWFTPETAAANHHDTYDKDLVELYFVQRVTIKVFSRSCLYRSWETLKPRRMKIRERRAPDPKATSSSPVVSTAPLAVGICTQAVV